MIPAGYAVALRPDARLRYPLELDARTISLLVEGATEADLLVHEPEPEAQAVLFYCLSRLKQCGALEYILTLPTGRVRVRPLRPPYEWKPVPPPPGGPYPLSRFALLRRKGTQMVLESPLAQARLYFDGWPQDSRALTELFHGAGFLEIGEPPSLNTWEFHDLLFHYQKPIGATYRFRGLTVAPLAVKPPMTAQPIALAPVSLNRDPPFSHVMASRHSAYKPGNDPITLAQLGEFLFRLAHLRHLEDGRIRRPIPAAGSLHELEFYPAVGSCSGLTRGLYHYHSDSHTLHWLAGGAEFERLLNRAQRAWGAGDQPPQTVIVIASRFARMAWKYESIAYRNTLLNAGVALEAMYLLAASMGLGACAIGWNAPDLFAVAAGVDPLEESSVAMLVLNSSPDQ
jgi:oxazoline/thiazoline dehydrogenase